MLKRFEGLNARVLPLMEDYLVALRSRDNTPASLLRMDKDHEKEMIDSYTNDIKRKIKGEPPIKSVSSCIDILELSLRVVPFPRLH